MQELDLETVRGRFAGLHQRNKDAMPMLALHGWLDNAASFLPMAPLLDQYDLVALDMPGHGRSFHYPYGAEYSLFSTLLDVLAAADALAWPRFTILGHSMGGVVASLLAAGAPERIERLYLIEALGPLAAADDTTAQRLRDAISQRRALDEKHKRVFTDVSLALRARMQSNITNVDEASAKLLIERGLSAVAGGYKWSSDARLTLPTAVRMSEAQIRDCLRAIECPVRLVGAEPAPPYFSPELRVARIACVNDIHCALVSGNHYVHMTNPKEVVTALGLIST